MNEEAIKKAGFRINAAGKIIGADGKMVKKEVAEQVANGAILANFNMDDLKKRKQRKQATGTADLVEALNKISPAIGLLEVGQTARLPIPREAANGKDPVRSFVMGVVTKLNNITAAGREWAGRKFDSLSDDAGEFFYITRKEDGEAHVRKVPTGRRAASDNSLEEALNRAKVHLGEGSEDNDEGGETKDPAKVTEEAQVITH